MTELDRERVAELTAQGSPPFAGSPETSVIVRYATFSDTPQGVLASPVVWSGDRGTFRLAGTVLLVEEADGWKVKRATPGSVALPAKLLPSGLPEHADTVPVVFSLIDAATQAPVYARVRIVDPDDVYWPPDGHQKHIRVGWRQDVGGDVKIADKTYAYVTPEFTAHLPPGTYTLEVRKGTEYRPVTHPFAVTTTSSKESLIEVAVERWIDMNAQGWYSGDTHTHFLDAPTGLLELRAEDLNVVYILASKWGELITDVTRFTGAPSKLSRDKQIVVYNEETRHRWLGHTILHGITELVYPLSWGGPSEGVSGGYDYPPMAYQADKAHAQNGLVTWAHFPYPGGELPVDVALGKVDTVDLFTWGDAFGPGPTLPNGVTLPGAIDTWYWLLNTNARLPATAGTDKMLNTQVTGSVKVFAYTGATFSYAGWLAALKSGKTIVSTGPVVTLSANGEPIGSELRLQPGEKVTVQADLRAPYDVYPVDTLEIVMGGNVVASVTNDQHRDRLNARVTVAPQTSTWVAARAYGAKLLPYQAWALLGTQGIPPMAHTSPIYLTVDEQPVWVAAAAEQLAQWVDVAIGWVQTEGHFRTEGHRHEMIELFKQAKRYYVNGPH